jgi:predicted ATPase/DNA-binding SARP family transcriptional activator
VSDGRRVEVLVLGPVRVRLDGVDTVPGGGRERGVLAALALAGPGGLDHDRLVDQMWGPNAPATAHRTAQAYLSRLRSVLGVDAVRTEAGRHRLEVDRVDLWEFDALVDEARREPATAPRCLTAALGLWRDTEPAQDASLDGGAEILAAVRRSRLDAAELRVLHLDDAEAAEAAEALIAEDPHRERGWVALATARYRLGRQSEALAALREARRRLAEDLGVDPSPELAQLEQDLLHHALPAASTIRPPAPLTGLVGRDELVATVVDAVGDGRLVTLVGAGGIGKTRVALAAVEAMMRSGSTPVFLADLSSLTASRSVDDALLEAIDATGEEVEEAFARRFGRIPGVLVVDACEHLLDTVAGRAQRLLARCARLRVLATSRSPLDLVGERLVDVPPLPTSGDEPSGPALRLFLDRAAEVVDVDGWSSRDLATAAEICRALEGIPLALEVAARRLRTLTLDELLAHVTSVPLPDDDAEPSGLVAALEDSFRALPPEHRLAFARLGVVQGVVPLVSAAAIAGDRSSVDALLRASLLTRTQHGVRMYEPVRRHALSKLSAEEREDVRRRIAEEVLAVTTTAVDRLVGPDEVDWLDRVDALHGDIRASLEWSESASPDLVPPITANVAFLWILGWSSREGRRWLDAALVHQTDDRTKARLWTWSAVVAVLSGQLERARRDGDHAVELAGRLGDERLLGTAMHARALSDKLGDTRHARALLHEAWLLRRAGGDLAGAAMSLGAIADIDVNEGRLEDAAERYALGLPLMRRADTVRGLLAYLHSMSELALMRGDAVEALALADEAEDLARRTHDAWHHALLASVRAAAVRDLGRPIEEQRELSRVALDAALAQPDPQVLLEVLEHVGGFLVDRGDHRTARRLLDGADRVREQDGIPRSVPRQERRDADAAVVAKQPAGPDVEVDLEWLVATATDVLGATGRAS